MLINTVITINWFILWYLIAISLGYLCLMCISLPDILRRYKEVEVLTLSTLMHFKIMPHLTIIVPAYNEEESILDTVYSILRSDYTNIDIVVVTPGSTDKTLEILIKEFDLIPVRPLMREEIPTVGKVKGYYVSRFLLNFTVIDKEHTNRSDTLNVGINACRTALCMSLDADTLLESTAISKAIFYMLSRVDTVCVGGCIYILNGCTFSEGQVIEKKMPRNLIYGFQACEYIRSFIFYRTAWNAFGALSYAGAFTCFQYETVVQLGGFEAENLAQDFEIVTHLQAYVAENKLASKISFTSAAIAYTDVPGTLKSYWQQRFNWQYWILHTLGKYKRMLFNPRYGMVGLFTYPFFLFGETLGPVVEFTAYVMCFLSWYLGILDVQWVILLILICWGFVTFLTMATALINFITFKKYRRISDLCLMLFYTLLENVGFHQFSVVCRTYATLCYLFDRLKPRREVSRDAR